MGAALGGGGGAMLSGIGLSGSDRVDRVSKRLDTSREAEVSNKDAEKFGMPHLTHSHAMLLLAHLSRRLIGELIVYPCSGVRPSSSVRRPSSSTISKILHIHHLQVGGKNNCVFCFDRIRTLVAMATYASHRLLMEKK